jgi:hypothetical protein
MQNIKMQYPTDADVLSYILHQIMDWKNGHCMSSCHARTRTRTCTRTPLDPPPIPFHALPIIVCPNSLVLRVLVIVNFDMTDEKDDTLEVEEIKVDEKTGQPVTPATTTPTSTNGTTGTPGEGTPAIRKCRIEVCNAVCKGDTDYCEWHQGRKPKPIATAPAKVS